MTKPGTIPAKVDGGDPIRATAWNEIIERIENLSTMGDGANTVSNSAGTFFRSSKVGNLFWEGTLQGILPVASNYLTGKASATAHRITRGDDGALTQTTVEITVVNHNPYQSGELGDVVSGYMVDGVFRVFWIYSSEEFASSTGTGTGCVFSLGGINLMDDLETSTSPSFVLGLDADGCLVKVGVAICPVGTGS